MKNRKQVGVNSLIRYTDRDFDSIKTSILNYIKRYYSDSANDFTSSAFGSMMVDVSCYIGDVLSFYLDYQANESFLDTAIEYENILKHGKIYGYKTDLGYSSYGLVAFYCVVPADNTTLGPDSDYIPVVSRGTVISSIDDKSFILIDDVDFSNNNEVRVASVSPSNGAPLSYAMKTYGRVVSGELKTISYSVGDYSQFLKVPLEEPNVTEVISVTDLDGNEYYEVDFLSQNTIYKEITNTESPSPEMILRPVIAARRFITRTDVDGTYLQFGGGSDNMLTQDYINSPQDVALNFHGKNYITNTTVDPSKLVKTDKFGISPSNTVLTITYRVNSYDNVNVGVGGIDTVATSGTYFRDSVNLDYETMNVVSNSVQVYNEDPIVGSVLTDNYEELKTRIFDMFSSQNRAVTNKDYKAMVYSMPSKFGAIKRANIISNPSSIVGSELNLYVASEDSDGYLTNANSVIKRNIKTWLSGVKMLSDRINIMDAKILNLAIDFNIRVADGFDKYSVLDECIATLSDYYSVLDEVGEPFMISDIYSKLKYIDGVLDCTAVHISHQSGGDYSDIRFDLSQAISKDGRQINIPKNVIVEIKNPSESIRGAVI